MSKIHKGRCNNIVLLFQIIFIMAWCLYRQHKKSGSVQDVNRSRTPPRASTPFVVMTARQVEEGSQEVTPTPSRASMEEDGPALPATLQEMVEEPKGDPIPIMSPSSSSTFSPTTSPSSTSGTSTPSNSSIDIKSELELEEKTKTTPMQNMIKVV